MKKGTCPVCGVEFEKKAHNQKFCSIVCQRESYKKYKKVCEFCGKEFRTQFEEQRFCSAECANSYLNPNRPKEPYEHVCLWCGKHFETMQPNSKYCSRKCFCESQRKNKKPVQKKMEIIDCPNCGKSFYKRVQNQKFCSKKCCQEFYRKKNKKQMPETKKQVCLNCGKPTDGKYCSTNCRLEHEFRMMMRKKAQGNQSMQEIIDASESIRVTYNGKLLNGWLSGGFTEHLKEEIKKRDGYRCYICHKETDLHVHHIIPRSQGGPNIPENLITLCSGCHRSIENGDVEKAIKRCVERAVRNVDF